MCIRTLLIIALYLIAIIWVAIGDEGVAFIVCAAMTGWFFWAWYGKLSAVWMPRGGALTGKVFKALPVAAAAIIFFTLNTLASFDVTDSFTFAVLFYIPMGYAAIFAGLSLMHYCFDISWIDDAINNDNKASVAAIAGGYIALAVIYSGANVGDGPGWWCVVFAGGLGFAAWILLWQIFHRFTNIFERVTVGRDVCCGVRLGCYFVAAGIILARASAGDWTSFGMTVVEFTDGWPVLPLMAAMVCVEKSVYKTESAYNDVSRMRTSIIFGASFVVIAALTVMFVIRPLPENAMYEINRQEDENFRLRMKELRDSGEGVEEGSGSTPQLPESRTPGVGADI